MKLMKSLVFASVLLVPGMVQAQSIVATTANSLVQFFENEGATVESTVDNVGDPKLKVEYYGNDFSVYYYGCDNNTNCDAIQFFSGYQTEGGVRLAKVNEWNTENRFARAYISEEGSARIEMDVFLGNDGVSADDFAQMVGIWARAMKDFEDLIDW